MRAYQDMVFTTAARLTGSDAHAEDISQEVFVRAYQHFEQLKGSTTPGGWLKTVATHLCINHLNRYTRRWRLFSELRSSDADEEAPQAECVVPDDLFEGLDAEQRRERVDAALRRLPDAQRLPLVLYHFEERSYEEIAALLRVSLPKVKTDIRRGRAALAPLLGDWRPT
jgi:RNA polymerase sigma-70 factor, ECF subfamily